MAVLRKLFCDDLHIRGLAEHTGFDSTNCHIGKQGVDLRTDKFGRWQLDGGDALRALRREPGHHAAAIGAECGKGFDIRQ